MAKKEISKEDLKRIRETAEGDDMSWLEKDKKFLIYLPKDLHLAAKKRAFDEELSLHDFILKTVKTYLEAMKKSR